MRIVVALAVLLAIPAPFSSPAQAHYPYWRPGSFPQCHDGAVKSKIARNFNWADAKTWYRGITIQSIGKEHERTVESFGPYPINRRYCRGVAYLSNGHTKTVHYRIEEKMGLAGTGWNVEFCVDGYDPWRVYDGYCRVLRR